MSYTSASLTTKGNLPQVQRGETGCSSTLALTSVLNGGWVVTDMPRPLYCQELPGTHRIGGWVGPRASLDSCEKSHPHQGSIPGPYSP